jgi:hypothetical protein
VKGQKFKRGKGNSLLITHYSSLISNPCHNGRIIILTCLCGSAVPQEAEEQSVHLQFLMKHGRFLLGVRYSWMAVYV